MYQYTCMFVLKKMAKVNTSDSLWNTVKHKAIYPIHFSI